ncbi:ROK family transcriptional regulator [Paenibacillus sp. LHD-117]|uniref:ROK family transcriptional regulator n=1 Tax=Paenibacillus sp. LHD-117 TaxID=3071412 RepID=UPI0027E1C9AC|nr:ROK family transcriptional regulator [Paenibacillus sp. LHD-117]MDQ6419640.1 ROK family transcriptional regulator [Paenibacillus sp. LHD-117]
MNKIGNQQMLREINLSTLLHAIFTHGPISRVELARKTKLSPTTVSVLIEDMIRERLVHETGTIGSGVGRKMTMLNIRADGGYVIGVDLSSAPVRCVLLNLNGELIAGQSFKPMIGEEQIKAELAAHITAFIQKHQIPIERIKRIGISLPGRLDETQSVVMTSTYLRLHQFPLRQTLEDQLPVPVLLSNDLDAAGFAERFSGAAKGDHTIIFLMIDYGTGVGIVINGQIYHGSNGSAGRTPFFAPYCTSILADRLLKEFPDTFGGKAHDEIVQHYVRLALEGVQPFDDQVELMISDIADFCGKALQLVNPQKMILGGWITDNAVFFDRLVTAIRESEKSPYGDTPVLPFHWKMHGSAMGAATLGLHSIFKQKTVQ